MIRISYFRCCLYRFAAGYGHLNVVKWLLLRGVDINFNSGSGSALIKAARFGHGKQNLNNDKNNRTLINNLFVTKFTI